MSASQRHNVADSGQVTGGRLSPLAALFYLPGRSRQRENKHLHDVRRKSNGMPVSGNAQSQLTGTAAMVRTELRDEHSQEY
jgi:hypothetical protein